MNSPVAPDRAPFLSASAGPRLEPPCRCVPISAGKWNLEGLHPGGQGQVGVLAGARRSEPGRATKGVSAQGSACMQYCTRAQSAAIYGYTRECIEWTHCTHNHHSVRTTQNIDAPCQTLGRCISQRYASCAGRAGGEAYMGQAGRSLPLRILFLSSPSALFPPPNLLLNALAFASRSITEAISSSAHSLLAHLHPASLYLSLGPYPQLLLSVCRIAPFCIR